MIARAHEQKLIFEAELRDGEARLLQLQAECEAQPQPLGPSVVELQKMNRPVDPGARRVAGQSSENSASRCVDDRWNSSHCAGSSSHARGPTRFGRMVELPQLRASERIGVQGRCRCGQSGSSGGTRVWENCGIRARYPNERRKKKAFAR